MWGSWTEACRQLKTFVNARLHVVGQFQVGVLEGHWHSDKRVETSLPQVGISIEFDAPVCFEEGHLDPRKKVRVAVGERFVVSPVQAPQE